MAAHPFDLRLQLLNEGFRTGGLPLRIERRGQRLGLRGRLPRRDGPGFQVQRLSLGLKADDTGLAAAVQQLQVICGDLASGRFCWNQWGGQQQRHLQPVGSTDGLSHALRRFQERFDADPVRSRNPAGRRSTWATAYWPYLRRLALIQGQRQSSLGQELLLQTLESYQLASRSRQQCATVLAGPGPSGGHPLAWGLVQTVRGLWSAPGWPSPTPYGPADHGGMAQNPQPSLALGVGGDGHLWSPQP